MRARTHKIIAEEIVLASFLATIYITNRNSQAVVEKSEQATIVDTETHFPMLNHSDYDEEQEEIRNEIMYGEIEMLAQLVEAEAGNQDIVGKRYVADVVLNRVDSADFPDTVEQVLLQDKQFSCINDGNFDKAGWYISDESFAVALEEYSETRLDSSIIYFRTDRYSDYGLPAFKYGSHYFSVGR